MRIQLFIFLTFCVYKCFSKHGCDETLRQLANVQSEFVVCAVTHSVPAAPCLNCYNQYRQMISHYKKLVTNCSDMYISQNRLNMVYNMELYLDAIWNKGFCEDCFDGSGTESSDSSNFTNLTTVLYNCLITFPKAPCPNCMDKYIELNDFFKEMEKEKKGKVCFDMQDAMNRTRVKWSKELKCCQRDFNLTLFLVGSGIFCAIPLIFYFGMYGYTIRLERNHEVIDSTYGIARQENAPATSSTTYGATSTREAPLGADGIETTDSLPSTSNQAVSALISL